MAAGDPRAWRRNRNVCVGGGGVSPIECVLLNDEKRCYALLFLRHSS